MKFSASYRMLILLFVSILLLQGTNQTAPTPKPCTSNQVEVNVANDAHTEANLMCLVSSEEVMDCQYYDLRGFCIQCPEGTSQSKIINSQIQACVPYAQQVVNCEGYRRFSPLDYECVGCMSSALLLVPLTGNPYGIPRACAQIYVPGCIEAREFTKNAASTVIGCSACSQGNDDYSKAGGRFNFQGGMNNGVACPADGIVSQCIVLRIVPEYGVYACDAMAACPSGKYPSYFLEGPINIGCLASTTLGFDPNCLAYNKFHTDFTPVAAELRCVMCLPGYEMTTVTGGKILCLQPSSAPPGIENCLEYDPIQAMICKRCVTGYSFDSKTGTCKSTMKGSSVNLQVQQNQEKEQTIANPCPPDTDEIRYFYSSQGNCIAIDSECSVYQQEKGCLKCKLPSQLHIDGLCYRSPQNVEFYTNKN